MRSRLLHLVTTLDHGGAENALLDLLPQLIASGKVYQHPCVQQG